MGKKTVARDTDRGPQPLRPVADPAPAEYCTFLRWHPNPPRATEQDTG
ncbi:hypothetical protein [Streptomyces sp. NPDC048650]